MKKIGCIYDKFQHIPIKLMRSPTNCRVMSNRKYNLLFSHVMCIRFLHHTFKLVKNDRDKKEIIKHQKEEKIFMI